MKVNPVQSSHTIRHAREPRPHVIEQTGRGERGVRHLLPPSSASASSSSETRSGTSREPHRRPSFATASRKTPSATLFMYQYMYINSPGGPHGASPARHDAYIAPSVRRVCVGAGEPAPWLLARAGSRSASCCRHARIMIHQPPAALQGQPPHRLQAREIHPASDQITTSW